MTDLIQLTPISDCKDYGTEHIETFLTSTTGPSRNTSYTDMSTSDTITETDFSETPPVKILTNASVVQLDLPFKPMCFVAFGTVSEYENRAKDARRKSRLEQVCGDVYVHILSLVFLD